MGLIPKRYSGLSSKLLISNLHQEAYLDGLYIGYILSMMALTDNKVSRDIIISVRDYILPYLVKNYYENKKILSINTMMINIIGLIKNNSDINLNIKEC